MTTKHADGRHGSIGRLLSTFEARLVDTETGQDVTSASQPGELWVRGPSVMKGYYKNPDSTKGTFAEDEKGGERWFKTGDSAIRDEEGFYRIADRLKELIKYKGFQGESIPFSFPFLIQISPKPHSVLHPTCSIPSHPPLARRSLRTGIMVR